MVFHVVKDSISLSPPKKKKKEKKELEAQTAMCQCLTITFKDCGCMAHDMLIKSREMNDQADTR